MSIFREEPYTLDLKELSNEEIEIICQRIEKHTAMLKYYVNLYRLFRYIKAGNGNDYYCLINNDLAESIYTLLRLEMAIPKNKSITDIIKEDCNFRAEMMKEIHKEIPKEKQWIARQNETLIKLGKRVQNPKLQQALKNYQDAVGSVYCIESLKNTTYKSAKNGYPLTATELDEQFDKFSSLGKVIYIGRDNDPFFVADEEITEFLYDKWQSNELTKEQFYKFLREHIKDLLGIVKDGTGTILARTRIKEIILKRCCTEETREITEDTYKDFLDKEIADRYNALLGRKIDKAGIDSILIFLWRFFSLNSYSDYSVDEKQHLDELRKIAIRSIVKNTANMELADDYVKLIITAFSPVNKIADANNNEDFSCALEASMELDPNDQKIPVLPLLRMTNNFDAERKKIIIDYLRRQDKHQQQEIANSMIVVLLRLAQIKNDPNLKEQINELIAKINEVLSEEKAKSNSQIAPKREIISKYKGSVLPSAYARYLKHEGVADEEFLEILSKSRKCDLRRAKSENQGVIQKVKKKLVK